MRKTFALIILPFVLLAAAGPFIEGQVLPTATYPYRDPTVIHLPCGIALDTRNANPVLPADLMLSSEQEGRGIYLVQFDGPIYEQERKALVNTGAVIDGYLPNYTYMVRMDQATRTAVSAIPDVAWVGDYHPGYKICPEIDLDAHLPQEFIVILYSGSKAESIREAVKTLDGELIEWEANEWETIARVNLAPEKIVSLVHEPQIKWIEPLHQDYAFNGQAQWVIQTWIQDNRRIWDKGLTGEGQILSSLDSGIRTTHNFFRDPSVPISDFGYYPDHRKIIAYQRSVGNILITFGDESGHGTHTAGSILGNDKPVGGSSINIGMAPDAKLFFLDGGGSSGGIYYGMDLESVLNKPHSEGDASLISNSWGSQTTRAYDTRCAQADRSMWGHAGYLVLFSGGNTDQGPYTGSPANAKNILCVGACKNGGYAFLTWEGSSAGPAGDGRIRPDIVTPGTNILSASFTGDAAEEGNYGTSMSCPIAAGNAALIRQYFTDGYYPDGVAGGAGHTPSGALLKAMMINSAETDYFNHPVPDDVVGWGRPNLDNVLYFPGDSRKLVIRDDANGLSTGQKFSTGIYVQTTNDPLRITLNWTDYPAAASASPALVNDLNLLVASPSGRTYRGNNLGNNNESVEGGEFDNLNPTENVFREFPEQGTWSIEVQANNVPHGPQSFALVVSGYVSPSGIEEENDVLPAPSPTLQVITSTFTDRLDLRLFIPHGGPLTLEMFDPAGSKVVTLIDERSHPEGETSYSFSPTDRSNRPLPSGIYFLRLKACGKQVISKTLHLK